MDVVIKVIGLIFILMGIVYMSQPQVMKTLLDFFSKGSRLYLAGVVRFALAVVFLLGARECDITWLIIAFGILFLLSGLLTFVIGPTKLKPVIDWARRQPTLVLRLIALVPVILGGIIIYAA